MAMERNIPAINPVNVTVQVREAVPGQKIKYTISTGFENTLAHPFTGKNGYDHTAAYQMIKRNQPFQNEIEVVEKDRGGLAMSYVFIQHNRVYTGEENFSIPWDNKDLQISYQSFRDKTLPGSDEQWTAR
jgi:aromatic ring-cleaving dioxygenase